jgi:hypothetical protein
MPTALICWRPPEATLDRLPAEPKPGSRRRKAPAPRRRPVVGPTESRRLTRRAAPPPDELDPRRARQTRATRPLCMRFLRHGPFLTPNSTGAPRVRSNRARHARTSPRAPPRRRAPGQARRAFRWPSPRPPTAPQLACLLARHALHGAPTGTYRCGRSLTFSTNVRPVVACGTSPRQKEHVSRWPCTGQAPRTLTRRNSRQPEDDQ